jgi:hypothetical protein
MPGLLLNCQVMNIKINVPDNFNSQGVVSFLSMLKFEKNLVVVASQATISSPAAEREEGTFCIDVLDGQNDLKVTTLEILLGSNTCSLLFFNQAVDQVKEPKIIFATDLSAEAKTTLTLFKQLKPTGFAGATMIPEPESSNFGTSMDDSSRTFLGRIKSTAQSTQANLIIANFDLGNISRKSMQMSNLVKMVLQNKCHVLILKS